MFQEIKLHLYGQFKQLISKAFISDKGIVAAITKLNKIIIFHESNPSQFIDLSNQLNYLHSFSSNNVKEIQYNNAKEIQYNNVKEIQFNNVKEIEQIHSPRQGQSQTTLMFMFGQTMCLVSLSSNNMNKDSEFTLEIKRIKLLNILEDVQIPQNTKHNLSLIGINKGTALFCLSIHFQQIRILSFDIDIDQHTINIQKNFDSTLLFGQTAQQQQYLLSSLFSNGYKGLKVRWINHYLIFFDQFVKSEQQNKLSIADLTTGIEGNRLRIKNIFDLPQRSNYSILKQVYFISPQQIQQSSCLLFYQYSTYLQIVEITLKNSTVPIKEIKHPFVILYDIVKCSISREQIQIKGVDYCRDNLNFVVRVKRGLDMPDKLMIIASPVSYKFVNCINQIDLPQQTIHSAKNSNSFFIISERKILKLSLTPKSSIYEAMLKHINAESLARIVEIILD